MPRVTGRVRARGGPRPSDHRPHARSIPEPPYLREAGVILIVAKLALVPLVVDPAGEDAFGVIKSSVSRALLYAILCVAAVYVLSFRGALRPLLAQRVPLVGATAFLGTAVLATLTAVDQRVALFGFHHRYLGLTSLADGVALTVAMMLFVRTAGDVRRVAAGLFAGAAGVLVYAGFQHARLDPIAWSDPLVGSTLGNRGVLAGYLTVIAAGAIAAAPGAYRAFGRAPALAVIALAAVAAVAVIASAARGPTLALPVALLVAAGLAMQADASVRALAMRARWALPVVGLGLVALIAAAVPRVRALVATGDTSLVERRIIYESAVEMIRTRPVLGAGPDHFGVLFPTVRPAGAAEVATLLAAGQTSAHSWFLHLGIGTGVVGSVVLLGLAAFCVWRAIRHSASDVSFASPLGASLLIAFLLQGAFNISSVGTEFLFWAALGLCATAPSTGTITGRPHPRRRPWVPLALAGVASLALGLSTLNWIAANRAVHESDRLRAAGQLARAERAAMVATDRDPGRANNWNVLGLSRANDPVRALAAFERAAAMAPYESRYLMNVVKEQARRAGADPALRQRVLVDATRAVAIDPRNAETHVVLSYALLINGDAEGAKREAEQALTLAPGEVRYLKFASDVYADAGDPAGAIRLLEMYIGRAYLGANTPNELLARLAELYAATGDRSRLSPPPAVPAPALVSVSRPAGSPADIHVTFSSSFGMATSGSRSVTDIARYRIQGRPLPDGASLSVIGPNTVAIKWPTGVRPSGSGETIEVMGVADVRGNVIAPDPSSFVLSPLPSPSLRSLSRECDPGGCVRRSHIYVHFDTPFGMATAGDGSIADAARYRVQGAHLPQGTVIEIASPTSAILKWPSTVPPPASGHVLEVVGARDRWGTLISPDPGRGVFPEAGPPRVRSATRECAPGACLRRSHIYVTFDTAFGMATSGPGSVADPSRYRFAGSALPEGVVIEVFQANAIVIKWPESSPDPAVGGAIEVQGVTDAWGTALARDGARVEVREGMLPLR